MNEIVLWDYPKSTASYRVRIALGLAGVDYRIETVNLLQGEHKARAHLLRNPQGFVPVLDVDGKRLTQSLAILEYLDETRSLGLLPADPVQKAKVRALAYSIAIDVHPVCNLSVAKHATNGQEPERTEWMKHFIRPGLLAFESLLVEFDQAQFCTGDNPSLADICLIPQLYNANRWGAVYNDCPRILAVETACKKHAAFNSAKPE
jgi:maleylacetoacetate isomerase